MTIQPIVLSICFCLLLFGCSTSDTADENTMLFVNEDGSTSLDKTRMQYYIAGAKHQLLLLEQQSSAQCISGQLAIANSYLSRASSEYDAGMKKDAFITLIDLDRQVRKIRCINKYINGQLSCGYTNKKVALKRWYEEGDFNNCEKSLVDIKDNNEEKKIKIEKNHVLITETLHDFNKDEIKPIYYPSLDKLVQLIKSYPNSTLQINGHTDSKGSVEYNNKLSQKRAQSVAKYFIDKGIEISQIKIKNMGEGNVREVEKNAVSRAFNRYTSITLALKTSGKKEM